MRIKNIHLSWFRGAADPVSLEAGGKSMVVYGVNASGKSTFVDALEYVLNGGRIGHLSHEYSGRYLEKAIPNTHKPHGRKTELLIRFSDDSELKTEITDNGTSKSSGAMLATIGTWDYRRTVLRQDEVAVSAALTEPWSNGPVEGRVNRLKTSKRQMQGRAGFQLLRARV